MGFCRSLFLPGPNCPLYVSVFYPETEEVSGEWVLHAPAFGEEMNKCRPMVARQARQLANSGCIVVVPDLSGTGDSQGEFADATWECWKEDLSYISRWAKANGANRLTLWGIRLGCLLATDVLCENPDSYRGLILWQPVHNGKQFMTQFLRLRMAASLMKGESETVSLLRDRLCNGEKLEIAGYQLSPILFKQIDGLVLSEFRLPDGVEVEIMELVDDASKSLLPVTRKQLELWEHCALNVRGNTVQGEQFWMTQEISLAPSLIDRTCSFFDGSSTRKQASLKLYNLEALLEERVHNESGVVFDCEGEQLVGIFHQADGVSSCGVLIVVGGPQYRVGSHRQFTQLARHLSAAGLPVFRFDYRGMGDSSGDLVGFEGIGTDIRRAIDKFFQVCEGLDQVVLWGLCDAATASVFYAPEDHRIKGMVLANPWVYSTQGAAKAYLKHYYAGRLLSRSFWQKVFRGEYDLVSSLKSLLGNVREATVSEELEGDEYFDELAAGPSASLNLAERFRVGLSRYEGKVLLLLSGEDLTAAQFKDAVTADQKLRNLLERGTVRQVELPQADHTFSNSHDSEQVERICTDWVRTL